MFLFKKKKSAKKLFKKNLYSLGEILLHAEDWWKMFNTSYNPFDRIFKTVLRFSKRSTYSLQPIWK